MSVYSKRSEKKEAAVVLPVYTTAKHNRLDLINDKWFIYIYVKFIFPNECDLVESIFFDRYNCLCTMGND